MKRTTLAYCLVMVLGVALVAVGLLDIRAQFLPTAASEILAPLGGPRYRPGHRGPDRTEHDPVGPGAAAAGEGAQ